MRFCWTKNAVGLTTIEGKLKVKSELVVHSVLKTYKKVDNSKDWPI